MKYYTLKFKTGTTTEIKGSKADLIAELQNLINEIEGIDEDEHDTDTCMSVPMYDGFDHSEYIMATICEE